MFEKILLAVDGSEPALHAAKVAGDLARTANTKELWIVIAYEPIPVYMGEPNLSNTINERMTEAQAILQEAKGVLGKIPAEVKDDILEGHMADSIVDVASTRQVDVIVMGSRGLGRLAGALMGSNSQRVISEAPCPVLVVK